ncbi:basic 7S globulin-like [Neltuma alba]|uniref:basic 7S globulin-like n=1 Tax=Neltuma alba TaxID=207710 RepID=UPI0010A4A036|nr:basic 7S globulin-like [Prosopis alba]XP_028798126.1 basic 7S globulin-like [Prosopis alba]
MASSSFHFFLFLFSLATFSVSPCFSLSDQSHPFNLPIKKDQSTNLYYASVGIGTPQHNMNLVIDLSGPTLWYDCNEHYNSSSFRPIPCESQKCPQTGGCVGCSGPFRPGCSNNTCGLNIINILGRFIYSGSLGDDVLDMPHLRVPHFLSGCSPSDSSSSSEFNALEGLPRGTSGIIGLARTELSVPAQLSSAYKKPLKFSLCLPSATNKGFADMLIGDREVSKFLQTTPLVVNPVATGPVSVSGVPSYEYFIDVKSIRIDGNVVNLKPSLLSIDKKGNGGTKISTMSPFAELHNSVYKPFLRQFIKQAADRKLKRVASVPPFEACYDSNTITRSGVPSIDLELQGGVKWTIHRTNSMVMTQKNVECLGFVDGGTKPRMSFVKASIVIGGHQLEDNLVVFDLNSSKLSFSSSLLLHNTSCSRF